MKAYIGFSRFCGSEEGAILIFATTVKEAKKAAFPSLLSLGIVEDWVDVGVRWLRDSEHLFDQVDKWSLTDNKAHVIEDPATCLNCGLWGGELLDNGKCTFCD